MDVVMSSTNSQRKKIHPHKFTLWVAIGSIVMMFAGLTSAYIVKSNQPKWLTFEMPRIFLYSTLVILMSSVTIQMALKQFKDRRINKYRNLLIVTLVLGSLFIIMQCLGFSQIWQSGITLAGSGAAPFMYVIFGLHGIHVLGGIVALMIILLQMLSTKRRSYNPVPIEVMSTYWHFVDILWVYLFVFFMFIQ